jgi:hypothetical protein
MTSLHRCKENPTVTSKAPLVLAAAASAIVLAGCAAGPRAQTSPPATSGSASADASSASTQTNAAAVLAQSPAAPAGAGPECGAAQLKTSYTDNSQIINGSLNGMSHHDSVVMFINEGSAPCWTRGYPGVALISSAGQQVRQAVRQPGTGTAPVIVLKPGQKASAELQANSASCSTYPPVAGLLVTAPDQTTSTRLGPPAQPLCLNSVTIGWLVLGNGGGTGY